ncbi:hypothetical protein HU200_047278 [Digitaria exilis]|uniref:Uncharacterized protein n=1 Tax=Digitaria exilis TaxID=1010633 RepID=A0A835AUH7_9POAL|nr:hypothetical protein HU200_047278 [Digitaria exilis]
MPLYLCIMTSFHSFLLSLDRESQGGAMLSAAIAIYLTFQHFNGAGSLRNAFRRASIVTTFSIICMTIVTLMLAF